MTFLSNMSAQKNPVAYQLYNSKGKKVSFKQLSRTLVEADVILFGELHNNPICHWLQLELTRALYGQKGESLVLGAEMFESDNQILLNEYFLGHISLKSFEREARLWDNYATDYKPLVEFAKENELKFVATNTPRRYASTVYKNGLAVLQNIPEYSKPYLPKLPIQEDYSLGCYKAMLEMGGHSSQAKDPKFYPQAQMIKDATMAYFIHNNRSDRELLLHFNGTFHSDNFEGIAWYLKKLNPSLNIAVISTIETKEANKIDKIHCKKATFTIAVPERMTKTY
jgi:uncharacterized iron-regulated protein